MLTRKILLTLTATLLFFLPGVTQTPSAKANNQPQGRRVALVIGNNAYHEAPLEDAVNDATDMAEALSLLGFDGFLYVNADGKNTREAIERFQAIINPGDIALLYFSGHGAQIDGENYLFTIQEDIALPVGDALSIMGAASLKILILDACRENYFGDRAGLAGIKTAHNAIVISATSPGKYAYEGEGRNSVFTNRLLEHIFTPNINIHEMLARITFDVSQETFRVQVPWVSSSLTQNFSFFKTSKPTFSLKICNDTKYPVSYFINAKINHLSPDRCAHHAKLPPDISQIRFDSSYTPGIQNKKYKLSSQEYSFQAINNGIELYYIKEDPYISNPQHTTLPGDKYCQLYPKYCY